MADMSRNAEIRDIITRAIDAMGTPSASVGIIQNGEMVFECAGYKNIESKLAPDKDTMYAIGSTSKAFTATALAILADEGKIDFDKTVKSYIPEFEMYDPYVTQNLTVGDILCHRCGLPRHEFMWYLNLENYKLCDIIDRLKYLKPNKPFRTDMQYQNHMFMVAGYLIERVSGMPWAQFVHERILTPLGMRNTCCDKAGFMSYANSATPYFLNKKNEPIELEFKNIDEIGAAGSINSTVADMLKWLQMNLNGGKHEGIQIVSAANLAKCHQPQMQIQYPTTANFKEIDLQSYGYGWFIETYKGVKVLQHGGSIDGFLAAVSIIPSINTGIVILTNHDVCATPPAIKYSLYDILLNLDRTDWITKVKAEITRVDIAGNAVDGKASMAETSGAKATHEIKEYAGIYENPAYGVYDIKCDNCKLTMEKDGFKVNFKHENYNNFTMNISEERDLVVKYKFDYDANGKICSLIVAFEDEPIVFAKQK